MTEYRQIMVSLPIEDLEYLIARPTREQITALKDAALKARDQWAEEVARHKAKFESFRVALVHALAMDEDATAEQIVAAVSWTDPPPVDEAVSELPADEYWCGTCKDTFPPNDHYHCVNCQQRTSMLGHPNGCPAPVEQPAEAVSTDGE
jgi:hypothetical protein